MMYEKEPKYRPLIGMDTDGIEHAAMFMSLNENEVKAHHRLYLTEIVPHTYRLCSSESMSAEACKALSVRCPLCGRRMRTLSAQRSGTRHALYVCDNCSRPR